MFYSLRFNHASVVTERMQKAFALLDDDHDGFISVETVPEKPKKRAKLFEQSLKRAYPSIRSSKELARFRAEGLISYQDFTAFLQS